MTVHLIKLCVGCDSPRDLFDWQRARLKEYRRRRQPQVLHHRTRSMPRRREEVLAGGSLYWVIRGVVQVRQRITGLEPVKDEDGRSFCEIRLDPELVITEPVPRQAFQGWRYFEAEDAPADLRVFAPDDAEALPPPRMLAELRALGLL
ncbi:MAG: DUF1489 domain-containing protein [Rhodospirillaceae bacterium]|nr:DUF1489 domain-containing protein [Rhodospirillaceae bacterium]